MNVLLKHAEELLRWVAERNNLVYIEKHVLGALVWYFNLFRFRFLRIYDLFTVYERLLDGYISSSCHIERSRSFNLSLLVFFNDHLIGVLLVLVVHQRTARFVRPALQPVIILSLRYRFFFKWEANLNDRIKILNSFFGAVVDTLKGNSLVDFLN